MKIQIAIAAAKKDPTKYKWYSLKRGSAHFDTAHKEYDLDLRKGDPFGIKFYRGSYFLIDKDDLTIQFKLSVEEGKKLLQRSQGWSGKVGGKTVQAGGEETATKPVSKRTPKTTTTKPVKQGGSKDSLNFTPEELDRKFKELGINRIKTTLSNDTPPIPMVKLPKAATSKFLSHIKNKKVLDGRDSGKAGYRWSMYEADIPNVGSFSYRLDHIKGTSTVFWKSASPKKST